MCLYTTKGALLGFLPCLHPFLWAPGADSQRGLLLCLGLQVTLNSGPHEAFKSPSKFHLLFPYPLAATSFSHAIIKLKQFLLERSYLTFWISVFLTALKLQVSEELKNIYDFGDWRAFSHYRSIILWFSTSSTSITNYFQKKKTVT